MHRQVDSESSSRATMQEGNHHSSTSTRYPSLFSTTSSAMTTAPSTPVPMSLTSDALSRVNLGSHPIRHSRSSSSSAVATSAARALSRRPRIDDHTRTPSASATPSVTSQSDDDEDDDDLSGKQFADKTFDRDPTRTPKNGLSRDLDDVASRVRPDIADGNERISLFSYDQDQVVVAEPVDADNKRRWRSNTVRSSGSSAGEASAGLERKASPDNKGKGRWDASDQIDVIQTRLGRNGVQEGAELAQRGSLAESLPPEILVHILKHLTSSTDVQSALLVSSSWCQVIVPTIWARPSLVRKSTLHRLIRILRSSSPTFQYASFIRRFNVISLQTTLTDPQFLEFGMCSRIERMTLTGSRHLSSDALCTVLGKMPRMVALDLTGVSGANDRVLKTIADSNERLQGINLTDCAQVTDDGVVYLASKAKLLRRIKLTNCQRLTDVSVTAIAEQCPLVLEFDVQGLGSMTDDSMFDIWLHCSHLRELQLHGNDRLTDAGFPFLKDMESDPLSKLKTASTIFSHLLPTKQINVNLLRPRPPPIMNHFGHLRKVDLTNCSGINDQAIAALVSNAAKIGTLTLNKCTALTDAALESISKLGSRLHYLHIGHCALVTDVGMSKLARACTRVRYLDVACCNLLTDMSVFEIAANMGKLNRIGLVKVSNVTDAAIYALAERRDRHGNNLTRVHLSYCGNITVKSITYLLMRLPNISHLSLTGVRNMSPAEYQKFCKPAPKEFNEHQRAAFCVFSGKNVGELRDYLLSKEEMARPSPSQDSTDSLPRANGRFAAPGGQNVPIDMSTEEETPPGWFISTTGSLPDPHRRRSSGQLRVGQRMQHRGWMQPNDDGLNRGEAGPSGANGTGGSNSPLSVEALGFAGLQASMQARSPQFFPDSAIGRSQARGEMSVHAPMASPLGETNGMLEYVDNMLRDIEERERPPPRFRSQRRSE